MSRLITLNSKSRFSIASDENGSNFALDRFSAAFSINQAWLEANNSSNALRVSRAVVTLEISANNSVEKIRKMSLIQ